MTKAKIAGTVSAVGLLVLVAFAAGQRAVERYLDRDHTKIWQEEISSHAGAQPAGAEVQQAYLFGRVSTADGITYVGRLRWGGHEEALWDHYFNGSKKENLWADQVEPERLKQPQPIEVLGFELGQRPRPINLDRPFMARFGDITRIEARGGRDLQVTLKSGTSFELDRFAADDFGDGLRVWDTTRGVVDLGERSIRTIELLPNSAPGPVPAPLHGTVRARQGDFTGTVQWNRRECLRTDTLDGRSDEGELSVRFENIRAIARHANDRSLVTLLDGREVVLFGTREVGDRHLGIYVDDRRFGRVLVSWDAFERVDFSPAVSSPAYDDYPPGSPLEGSITTRAGQHLAGRLVFDLDESETTETLDAPLDGVDYTIPFRLIASIRPPDLEEGGAQHTRVSLHNGEELQLQRAGDLAEGNAGMLVFVAGRERPEYVPWAEVERIDFVGPQALNSPPSDQR